MRILDYRVIWNKEVLLVIAWMISMSLIGFAMMGIDKAKAKKHAYRIPEKMLFLVALIGGGAGSWIGMYTFRHKTKHWYFVAGMPIITVLQVIFLILGWFFYILV